MPSFISKIWKNHRGFIIFAILLVGFRSAIADWNVVPTGSMKPTIVEGDRIAVNKLAYDLRIPLTHISLFKLADPLRGDIVIFDSKAADKRMVKRVIGLPGDVIAMAGNQLYINGTKQQYRLLEHDSQSLIVEETLGSLKHRIKIDSQPGNTMNSFKPVRVPADHYLVLGDNRDNSADSRVYGFIPRSEIVGRSSKVIISLDYDDYYLPRGERFWQSL